MAKTRSEFSKDTLPIAGFSSLPASVIQDVRDCINAKYLANADIRKKIDIRQFQEEEYSPIFKTSYFYTYIRMNPNVASQKFSHATLDQGLLNKIKEYYAGYIHSSKIDLPSELHSKKRKSLHNPDYLTALYVGQHDRSEKKKLTFVDRDRTKSVSTAEKSGQKRAADRANDSDMEKPVAKKPRRYESPRTPYSSQTTGVLLFFPLPAIVVTAEAVEAVEAVEIEVIDIIDDKIPYAEVVDESSSLDDVKFYRY